MISCPKCAALCPEGAARCPACAASLVSTTRIERRESGSGARPQQAAGPLVVLRALRIPLAAILALILGVVAWEWWSTGVDVGMESGLHFRLPRGFVATPEKVQSPLTIKTWRHGSVGVIVEILHSTQAAEMPTDKLNMEKGMEQLLDALLPRDMEFPAFVYRSMNGRASVECSISGPQIGKRLAETLKIPAHCLAILEQNLSTVEFAMVREGDHFALWFLGYDRPGDLVTRTKRALQTLEFGVK